MRTIEEQIEIMQHFANGGSIEIYKDDKWSDITNSDFKNWNFATFDFRIKEQKKTVTIEKWLIKNSKNRYDIEITSNIDELLEGFIGWEKIKLLKTYEVEL